jgi:hypothetical protein
LICVNVVGYREIQRSDMIIKRHEWITIAGYVVLTLTAAALIAVFTL